MASDVVRIVVEGNPPRKDNWHKNVPGRGRALSKVAKEWIGELQVAWVKQRMPKINEGRWAMSLDIYVVQKAHLERESFPRRDCDSSVSPVLDALQRVGWLDDDMRIAPILLDKHHDPKRPRVEIVLRRRFDD